MPRPARFPAPSRALVATLVLLALFTAGCTSDPEILVNRTLDAREEAMAKLDVDKYVSLFHPDYQYAEGETETVASATRKRFAKYTTIILRTTDRRIILEHNGKIARVIQDYEMQAHLKNGKVLKLSGQDHFLLKRKSNLFGLLGTEYLFYQGVGV
ncbi:MAG: hypothetical protein H6684_12605 [Deltaproteobacteria bacterium]|nr:hypothetical protein [bacterium]MCB9476885.1 hypothetical protein [Deltaproteobacteria bacterium]MCB9480044.1 hypothetical protein [Deltaproteobacteria bacterium]MCB9489565.1 hypothetical protein [Deltaproteobacteria bacterium]